MFCAILVVVGDSVLVLGGELGQAHFEALHVGFHLDGHCLAASRLIVVEDHRMRQLHSPCQLAEFYLRIDRLQHSVVGLLGSLWALLLDDFENSQLLLFRRLIRLGALSLGVVLCCFTSTKDYSATVLSVFLFLLVVVLLRLPEMMMVLGSLG